MALVITLVSPVSSIGTRDSNTIYTMILYEDMKSIEHVLLHPICVFSHLTCICKHSNEKLPHIIEHIGVADEFII